MGAAQVRASDQKGSEDAMDNSLLVSLSQQLASYRAMDVIANNIANAATPGFKRETAKFEEYVMRLQPGEGQRGLQSVSFVKDAGILRDTSQGTLEKTGAPFDIAIAGNGYFAVQTPAGMRYTRDGHFSLDAAGQIVTSDGHIVQGDGGAITITPDDGDIQIAPDGTVSGKTGQLARLRVVEFANDRALMKEGANLYATDQAANTVAAPTLRQPVLEISRMIEVMRAYEATATLSKSHEDLKRQAIEKLGRMPA